MEQENWQTETEIVKYIYLIRGFLLMVGGRG